MADDGSPADDYSSSSDWELPPRTEEEKVGRSSSGGLPMEGIASESRFAEMERAEKDLAGDEVQVKFTFPDGEECSAHFPHGQTVSFMKFWLEDNRQIPYEKQSLTCCGTELLDPLSLNDIKEIKTGGGQRDHCLSLIRSLPPHTFLQSSSVPSLPPSPLFF
eukprot:Sspe_Gene.69064::Locus_40702_Transcript_1_1_Confidence_1.000_Length_726::g.69064::m.69064